MNLLEISLINIIVWFFTGIITAYYVHFGDKRGLVTTSIFAVLGAEIGGYLASFISGKAMYALSIDGLLYAVVGAAILAIFYRFSFNKENSYFG